MRRLVFMVSTVALLLLAFAPPVAADTVGSPRENFTTVGFDAFASDCGRTVCTDVFMFAEVQTTDSGETFTILCVDRSTTNIRSGAHSHSGGCTETANLTVAEDLSSATLAPTTVTICGDRRCEQVTVSAELTGTGGTASFSNRFTENDGVCRFTFTSRGERRFADGTITLDGETSAAGGSIFEADVTVTRRCR